MAKTMTLVLASILVSMPAHAEDAPRVPIPPAIQAKITALGCEGCHGWKRSKFGPAWQNVADRYRGQTIYYYKGYNIKSKGEKLPIVPGLVKKISKGGKGEWNEYIPKAPIDFDGNHKKEITDIVNFILSIPPRKKE
jgi:cytochrome c551/c552